VEQMEVLQLAREGHIRAAFGYVKGAMKSAQYLIP
jgi:hypothetical protein